MLESMMFTRIGVNEVVNFAMEYMSKENMRFIEIDNHQGYASKDWNAERERYIQDLEVSKRMMECFLTYLLRKKSVIGKYDIVELMTRTDGFVDFIINDTYIPEES